MRDLKKFFLSFFNVVVVISQIQFRMSANVSPWQQLLPIILPAEALKRLEMQLPPLLKQLLPIIIIWKL